MNAKKIVGVVAAAVVVYSLIVYPTQLAEGTRSVFGWASDGVDAVLTFMRSLFA
jgi:hypothetical protein